MFFVTVVASSNNKRMEVHVKLLTLCAVSALMVSGAAIAQTKDGSEVLLPLEAQTCNLPNPPSRVPDDADMEALKAGKAAVTAFQDKLIGFRDCLNASTVNENITDGNKLAVTRAHDDSIDMEERVAEQFNVAIRAYKARIAADKE